ncbi:flagellar assembly protein FliW [Acidithiobacillus sp. AMEEHan]|uniref:flagellar assembly protein FliW n=1 Tax=Acidithiobacillus sp. AMEEHan TaxID=2994951 RepID=UPI0027E46F9C|nr:flagellar assembly protein FliW [Acidithiobacillus sp. AMEEHan]
MSESLYPTRFGQLPISDAQIWQCSPPLSGFADLQRFALLHVDKQGPFLWLQSLDDPMIAFLLCAPEHFGLHYDPPEPCCADGVNLLLVILPQKAEDQLRVHQLAPLYFCPGQRSLRQWIVEQAQPASGGSSDLPPDCLLAHAVRLGTVTDTKSQTGTL